MAGSGATGAAGAAGGAGSALGLFGAGTSAFGTLMAGGQANADAKFRAAQLQQNADAQVAASQRTAEETRRKGALVQSSLQAKAAASGGGATDPTILNLGSDIAGRTEYSALTDLYNGQNRSAGLLNEEAGTLATGKAQQTGSYFRAGGTLLSGLGGMYKKFGTPDYSTPYG